MMRVPHGQPARLAARLLVVALAWSAAPAQAQRGTDLSPPGPSDAAPQAPPPPAGPSVAVPYGPPPPPAPFVVEEVRALRLAGRAEDALARAELIVAAPLSATARPLRALMREVGALENPEADRTWIHAALVCLPFGGAGALASVATWLLTSFGGWDPYEVSGIVTASVVSGALVVAGITLLLVHLGENNLNGDHAAFELRRHDVLEPLREAYRRAPRAR